MIEIALDEVERNIKSLKYKKSSKIDVKINYLNVEETFFPNVEHRIK